MLHLLSSTAFRPEKSTAAHGLCGTPVGHGDFEMYPAAVPYLIGHLQRTMRRNLLLYIAVIQQLCKFVIILRMNQFAAVLTHGRHKRMMIILQHGLKI